MGSQARQNRGDFTSQKMAPECLQGVFEGSVEVSDRPGLWVPPYEPFYYLSIDEFQIAVVRIRVDDRRMVARFSMRNRWTGSRSRKWSFRDIVMFHAPMKQYWSVIRQHFSTRKKV